jgi:hypothetical protein
VGVRWRRLGSRAPAARRSEPKRRSAAGTALRTQLVVTSMARAPLGSRALSYPPFVTQSPNETIFLADEQYPNRARELLVRACTSLRVCRSSG